MSKNTDALKKIRAQVTAAAMAGVESGFGFAEGVAKNNAPYDSGYLRANINHSVREVDGDIIGRLSAGNASEYAVYLHEGTGIHAKGGGGRKTPWWWYGDTKKYKGWYLTSGQKPQPFLRDAVENNKTTIDSLIKSALKRVTG